MPRNIELEFELTGGVDNLVCAHSKPQELAARQRRARLRHRLGKRGRYRGLQNCLVAFDQEVEKSRRGGKLRRMKSNAAVGCSEFQSTFGAPC
jgi:hypothetical protein